MQVQRTMHSTTVVEGYVDEDNARYIIEQMDVYNRAHPFIQASIRYFNNAFNLGAWDAGNPEPEQSRQKFRIIFPEILYFDIEN